MSILSAMIHGESQDLPSEVHNSTDKKQQNNKDILTQNAKKTKQALEQDTVHPAMFYSEDCSQIKNGYIQESAHAVESKLEMREEYPYG